MFSATECILESVFFTKFDRGLTGLVSGEE